MKIDTQISVTGSADSRPAAAAAERAGYAAIWTSEVKHDPFTVPALAQGRGDLADFEVSGSPLVITGQTEEEMNQARRGVREQIAFYGSTPAYRPVLELHGWGALSEELHALSRQGQWQQMGTLINDQVLDAFAVTAEPGQVAAELLRRYGDIMTRMTLYTPYAIDAAVTRQIAAGLQDEPVS